MIDGDGRSEEAIETLRDRGVFALDAFSIESLYYCSESLEAVARWQEESLGRPAGSMMQPALDAAFASLREDGLAERMAARRCEHVVRNRFLSHAPNWETIRDGGQPDISISVTSPYQEELLPDSKISWRPGTSTNLWAGIRSERVRCLYRNVADSSVGVLLVSLQISRALEC